MPGSILTVLTPAPDRRLATAVDVRAELMLPGGTFDNDLNGLILQASDTIASGCGGRVFGREGLRETFRSVRTEELVLARDPVAAVTSIVADGSTLVEGTDFELDAMAGILYRLAGDSRCAWRVSKVTVEYEAGWLLPSQAGAGDVGALPTDVRRICIERVARAWNGRGRDATIRSEGTDGVDSISYFDPDKLSTDEADRLRGYKVVLV